MLTLFHRSSKKKEIEIGRNEEPCKHNQTDVIEKSKNASVVRASLLFFHEFPCTHRVFRLAAFRGEVKFIHLVTHGRPRVK